jgi:hypothetical protein
VRARNIRTIGDLSSLTEGDIHGLPIRSPKVDTVKKVLTKFGKNIGCKNIGSTRPKRSSKTNLDSQLKSGICNIDQNVGSFAWCSLASPTYHITGIVLIQTPDVLY